MGKCSLLQVKSEWRNIQWVRVDFGFSRIPLFCNILISGGHFALGGWVGGGGEWVGGGEGLGHI